MNFSHPHHASRLGQVSPAKGPRRFSANLQPELFSDPQIGTPGSMNDAQMVRAVVADAMNRSGKSRATIADEMTYLAGVSVTERMLNNFAAESRGEYRFPSELERAFCAATGDDRLLTCRAEAAGLHVIDETGWKLLELGREFLRQKRAAAGVASLEKHLAGVEL